MTDQIETVVTHCDLDAVKQKQLVMSIISAVGRTVNDYYRSTTTVVDGVELKTQVAIPSMTEEALNEVMTEVDKNLAITLKPVVRDVQVDWGMYQPPVTTSADYHSKSAILVVQLTVKEWGRSKYML